MPKGKILFIDDDNFLRKVYQSELSDKGFTVSLAADGEEGLSKMKSEAPDLVILDLIMPKKSGFEILVDVQQAPELAAIPIIVLSNLAQSEDQERALGLGAVDYLVKDNTTLDTIADKIAYHLSAGVANRSRVGSAVKHVTPLPKATATEAAKVTPTNVREKVKEADGSAAATSGGVAVARGHNFCPQCGYPVVGKVQFCPDCGMKLI